MSCEFSSFAIGEETEDTAGGLFPSGGYPQTVAIDRLRERLPLVVFVLLLVFGLLLLGFACACITDHPAQAIERALAAVATAPPIIEVWSVNAFALVFLTLALARQARLRPRPSPADLQRFLL